MINRLLLTGNSCLNPLVRSQIMHTFKFCIVIRISVHVSSYFLVSKKKIIAHQFSKIAVAPSFSCSFFDLFCFSLFSGRCYTIGRAVRKVHQVNSANTNSKAYKVLYSCSQTDNPAVLSSSETKISSDYDLVFDHFLSAHICVIRGKNYKG